MAAMFGLLTLASCGKDEDPAPAGSVDYDGQSYALNNGIYFDNGADDTYYNNYFLASDGTLDLAAIFAESVQGKAGMSFDLYSVGTDEFKSGTFTIKNNTIILGRQEAENYGYVEFSYDSNNDGKIDETDDSIEAKSGTVTVSGSNYDMEFNLVLANDKTLKGVYKKGYSLIDFGF